MASVLSVKKNDYHKNPKESTIMTPPEISLFLHKIISPYISEGRNVLDPACGGLSLLKPWEGRWRTHGYDVNPVKPESFLKTVASVHNYFDDLDVAVQPDLVLLNPPFNKTVQWSKDTAGKLIKPKLMIPDAFLRRTFALFGESIPVVIFVPMGFRLNQRRVSKRFRYYRDDCTAKLTSIISLPLDSFPEVEFHMEILCWNMPYLDPHYFLTEDALPVYKKLKKELDDGEEKNQ